MTPLLERDVYLFDLDNTLYRPKEQLIEQIVTRMTDAVARHLSISADASYRLCDDYYLKYGGTLRGIQLHHPNADLNAITYEAHDVDLTNVSIDPAMQQALADNSKTRYVFTNSPRFYAERVLNHLGLSQYFDDVFTVEQTGFQMKPDPHAFVTISKHFGFDANNAVMFDDQENNLATARQLGMRTVLVNRHDLARHDACYRTEALPSFIDELNKK